MRQWDAYCTAVNWFIPLRPPRFRPNAHEHTRMNWIKRLQNRIPLVFASTVRAWYATRSLVFAPLPDRAATSCRDYGGPSPVRIADRYTQCHLHQRNAS